jgi:hypothetical protein
MRVFDSELTLIMDREGGITRSYPSVNITPCNFTVKSEFLLC